MIAAALLLLAATPADTSTVSAPARLRVLILPTITGEVIEREPKLEEGALRAFSETFTDAALGMFAWRRFQVLSGSEAIAALESAIAGGDVQATELACRSGSCAREVGRGAGATHVAFSRLTRTRDGSCAVFAALYDLLRGVTARELRRAIVPCSADNLLATALDLGRELAEGPRAPVQVTLNLTPRELPNIDPPDLPDVSYYNVRTSTRARRTPLELGLDIYRKQHMFVFEDEQHAGLFFVARGDRLVNECDIRRAATVPIPSHVLEFCEGNDWEWAWLALPIGLAFAGLGASELGQDSGTVEFAFGSGLALTSVLIAVLFNVDAVDVESGRFYSSRDQIDAIVARNNAELRKTLDLTEAEVAVAGMRR